MTDIGAPRTAAGPEVSIDLREGEHQPAAEAGPVLAPAPTPPPFAPPEPGPPVVEPEGSTPHDDPPEEHEVAQRSGPSRARGVLIAVLVGLLVLACLEVFLLPAAYRVRQTHRLDEYREAKQHVAEGEPALALQAPTIGMDLVVVKGATPDLLRGGPGWRDGSAPPGQGNTVILGHSTRWGYPFGRLDELKSGNPIYVRTRDDRVYVYKVTKVRTVDDDATGVMDPSGPQRLTLITSAGGPLDGRRLVVQAGRSGPQPAVPKAQKVDVVDTKRPGPFDERGGGGMLLLLAGAAVAAIGVYGFVELRHRYQMVTVICVAGPAIALGVVLVLFNLDAFVPLTY